VKKELFKPEYDNHVRTAKVSVLLSLLGFWGFDFACCKHWAIIFKFDNRTIRYEITAIPDDKGVSKITPQWHDDDTPEGKFNRMIELGNVETSPLKLHEIGKTNRLNYKEYTLLHGNCQEWAKDMLLNISKKLLEELEKNDIKSIKVRVGEKCSKIEESSLKPSSSCMIM
jgi:hypothetical protein